MSKESKTYKNLPKKVYIRTFGCQMNDRDSEIIKGMLIERGFVFTPNLEEADVILFNTCSVRAHAEERVYGKLGMLKALKKERPEIIFGVLGCMAQNYKEEIFKKAPYVDLVCGTGNIYELPDLLEKLCGVKPPPIESHDRMFIVVRHRGAKGTVTEIRWGPAITPAS